MSETRTGTLSGVGPLVVMELRRWLPRRAAVIAVVSPLFLVLVTLVFRGDPGTPFGQVLSLGLVGWVAVVVVIVIAVAQSVLAGDVEDGTAAWVVSMPVTRTAVVVSKFLAAAPVVALSAVLVPGLAVYPLLSASASASSTRDFDAAAVIDALARGPESFSGLPSLGTYLGMLSLIALLAVFLVAVMLLMGTRLVSTAALLGVGLATSGVLAALTVAGVAEGSPGVAFAAVFAGRFDDLSLGVAFGASAMWSLVVVALAAWSFQRRSL